jgi:uncharacterized membrane protein
MLPVLENATMNALRDVGRVLFAISIAVFGLQYLFYGRFVGGLAPVPPWVPGGSIGSYLVGVFLIATAIGMATKRQARLSAISLGLFFLFCVLFLHTWHFRAVVTQGNDRTRALEPLAMAAVSFVLAGTFPKTATGSSAWSSFENVLIKSGRFVFAFTMIIFGMQHFQYAAFIATLIPAWIPVHLFWVYLTGFGFIAAAVAICLRILGRLAALSLGLMFLLWFFVLHLPRAFAALHNGDEWSSAFVALCMAGACFFIASTVPNQPDGPAA